MKIYAITVVKNEVDIVGYVLQKAQEWADKVLVYDNGSTDGTWERVNQLANNCIIPFKQDFKPYSDGLRADIFNAYKNELSDGDWWVLQDSDEVFAQNPREFLKHQHSYFHHVNGHKVDICFDLNKVDDLEFDKTFENNLGLFDHFYPLAWSEPRLIKHRKRLKWKVEDVWPSAMGVRCKELIPIYHYPFRSREQIIERWKTRKIVGATGWKVTRWDKLDWKDTINDKRIRQCSFIHKKKVFENSILGNNPKQGMITLLFKHVLHRAKILP